MISPIRRLMHDPCKSLRLQRRFQSANVHSLHHAAVSLYTGSDAAETRQQNQTIPDTDGPYWPNHDPFPPCCSFTFLTIQQSQTCMCNKRRTKISHLNKSEKISPRCTKNLSEGKLQGLSRTNRGRSSWRHSKNAFVLVCTWWGVAFWT